MPLFVISSPGGAFPSPSSEAESAVGPAGVDIAADRIKQLRYPQILVRPAASLKD